jgi:hypothetical protein
MLSESMENNDKKENQMIKFEDRQIEFTKYPFAAASVYPDGILHAKDIKEVLLNQMPPELRTKGGEIIGSSLYWMGKDKDVSFITLPPLREFQRLEQPSRRALDRCSNL